MTTDTETTVATSLRQQLAALEVGGSVCLAKKLDQDAATRDDLAEALEKLHNTGRKAMARASHETKLAFTGESGSWRTGARQGSDPVVCFLITRTA